MENIRMQFKTADEARQALECLQMEGIRIAKSKVIKSLPDFKGHVNRNYSLYLLPFSEADHIMISRRARTHTLGNI